MFCVGFDLLAITEGNWTFPSVIPTESLHNPVCHGCDQSQSIQLRWNEVSWSTLLQLAHSMTLQSQHAVRATCMIWHVLGSSCCVETWLGETSTMTANEIHRLTTAISTVYTPTRQSYIPDFLPPSLTDNARQQTFNWNLGCYACHVNRRLEIHMTCHAKTTSSTKPEVANVSQSHQATCTKIWWCSGMWFLS